MPRTQLVIEAGQRIGRGVVIDPDVRIPRANRTGLRGARLLCDCGNEYVSALQALVGKRPEDQRAMSCGCLRRERQIKAVTTHGMSRRGTQQHPLMKTWEAMISRCESPNDVSYAYYGGRDITVCERWHDPILFAQDIETALGPRPDGSSLDRIDNDGNYEPGNCRWATAAEQAANRRPRTYGGPGSRGADPRPYPSTCERCGSTFQAARPAARFCSKACKAAAQRARVAE